MYRPRDDLTRERRHPWGRSAGNAGPPDLDKGFRRGKRECRGALRALKFL
ncbi:protease modulator HflK N-terminal domain-containing protein [Methylocystis echinoides]